jgi:hypothetical protein
VKISAVVVTYRRLKNLGKVLEAWLRETPDVWLCDCSPGGFQTTLPVKIVRAQPDPGNKIRHAVATLTDGDLVFKADDDLLPLPGLVKTFEFAYAQLLGPAILGIHGRIFQGPRYYGQTKMIGQGKHDVPIKVDFVGVITAAPRAVLPMDLRGCSSEVEDLFWQMAWYPKIPKWVVPTKGLIQHLPESFDKDRLCGGPESRRIRQRFYETWYRKNYAPGTRP